tara:strand:+ start:77 stop:553 length:477 start_codon:yes stop_codon:yes gene_type:complete
MGFSEINWYCDTDYMLNVWENCGRKPTTLKDKNISEFIKPLASAFKDAFHEEKYKLGILQRVTNKEEDVGSNWKSAWIWGVEPFHLEINGHKMHGALIDATKPRTIKGIHLAVYTSLHYEGLKVGYDNWWGVPTMRRRKVTAKEVFGGYVRRDELDVV